MAIETELVWASPTEVGLWASPTGVELWALPTEMELWALPTEVLLLTPSSVGVFWTPSTVVSGWAPPTMAFSKVCSLYSQLSSFCCREALSWRSVFITSLNLVAKGKIAVDQGSLATCYLGVWVCCLFSRGGLTSSLSGLSKWAACLGLNAECFFLYDEYWAFPACSRVSTFTVWALPGLLVWALIQSVVCAWAHWTHSLSSPAGTGSMAKLLALKAPSGCRDLDGLCWDCSAGSWELW